MSNDMCNFTVSYLTNKGRKQILSNCRLLTRMYGISSYQGPAIERERHAVMRLQVDIRGSGIFVSVKGSVTGKTRTKGKQERTLACQRD